MPARSLDQIVSLSKRRGFVFPGSAAYGGLGSFWDYGPLGAELMRNVKDAWWKAMTWERDDIEGVDCAILMNRKVWQHSGHEATFSDPLVDNKKTKKRYRLDHLLAAQSPQLLKELQAMLQRLLNAATLRESAQASIGWPDTVDLNWIMTGLVEYGHFLEPTAVLSMGYRHPEGHEFNMMHFKPTGKDGLRVEFAVARSGYDQTKTPLGEYDIVDVVRAQSPEWREKWYRHFSEYPPLIAGRPSSKPEDLALCIATAYRNRWHAAGLLMTHFCVTEPGTNEAGDWSQPRRFNLMFQSHVGPVEAAPGTEEELASRVYLRPETAQGIFMNFKNVLDSSRRKLPFGIAQIGKAFRNEITPGNFTFRTREFEQMELEFFIKPPQFLREGEKTDEQWHAEWVDARYRWWISLGIDTSRLRKRAQDKSELAHYAKATTDLEYLFPGSLGWGEVEGVANRTDFDLSAHSREVPEADLKRLKLEANKDSVTTLDYFDTEAKARYIPWVIEPSAGATRAALTFLCEAYHEEMVKEPPQAEIEALKTEIDAVIKNADKKKKDAEKEKDPAQRKHDPVAISAFQAALAEAASRLPASLMEIDTMLEDHAGAQNLEPVKKLKPKVNKLAEDCVRVVLKLHPKLAPVKVAVFPLARNKPELVDIAQRVSRELRHFCKAIYDDSAGIGKLYRRQDEIGTPLCVTVDHQTLEDNMVTVRDRDTMDQVRISLEQLPHEIRRRLQLH